MRGTGRKHLLLLRNFHAHFPQCSKMDINRPPSDYTAAGIRHYSLPNPPQHSSEQHDRRTHPCHRFPRHTVITDLGRIYRHRIPRPADRTAQFLKKILHMIYIRYTRTVSDNTSPSDQQRRSQYRKHCILRPLHPYLSP